MAFDPCREWLGLAAVDLTDPCRVLGLAAGRHRAEAIEEAAAKRLATLGEIVPGAFAKAHAALVGRVAAARDELLADALPSAPSPYVAGPTASAAVFATHEASAALPCGGEPLHMEAALHADRPATPSAHPPRPPCGRPHRPAEGSGGLVLASMGLLSAAIAVLAFLVFRPQSPIERDTALTQSPLQGVVEDQAQEEMSPEPRSAQSPRRTRPKPHSDEQDGDQRSTIAMPAAPPSASAAEMPDQRLQAERARLAKAFDEAIRETYAALKDHRFAVADRAITRADQHAGDDLEAARRLERWRLLATYARQFVDFREQAFAAANAGREFEAGGVRFSIIEITPDLFIYKSEGEIRRVPRVGVDPMIEMAVVGTWFERDGRAANHLFLGAGWLCRERPNLRRTQAEWRTAGDGGENVGPLLALLDDPAVRPSAR